MKQGTQLEHWNIGHSVITVRAEVDFCHTVLWYFSIMFYGVIKAH